MNKNLGPRWISIYVILAIFVVYMIVQTFQCPDCTGTRLFLDNWRQYLVVFLVVMAIGFGPETIAWLKRLK